jgi:hypothetical protein
LVLVGQLEGLVVFELPRTPIAEVQLLGIYLLGTWMYKDEKKGCGSRDPDPSPPSTFVPGRGSVATIASSSLHVSRDLLVASIGLEATERKEVLLFALV